MGKVLVIGSTGRVGAVVMELLAQQGVPVRAVSRRPDRLPAIEGVERVPFDFHNPATFDPALEGIERVFLMTPPGVSAVIEGLSPILERAFPVAQKIVLVTMRGVEDEPRSQVRRLEQSVESSGVPFVVLRPNIFMDNFHTLWRDDLNRTQTLSLPAGDAEISFVYARDVGACAVKALSSDTFDGRAFTLTGPQSLSLDRAAEIFTKIVGKTFRYQDVEDEQFRQSLVQANLPPNYIKTLLALFAVAREGRCAEVTDSVEELLGRPATSFAKYVDIHAVTWGLKRH
jgi:uncharacterized protein YbjT (DUF2867 family)